MTTKVTIDAHAGWSVQVTAVDTGTGAALPPEIVAAGEVREFHVWQGRNLVVMEMPKDEAR